MTDAKFHDCLEVTVARSQVEDARDALYAFTESLQWAEQGYDITGGTEEAGDGPVTLELQIVHEPGSGPHGALGSDELLLDRDVLRWLAAKGIDAEIGSARRYITYADGAMQEGLTLAELRKNWVRSTTGP